MTVASVDVGLLAELVWVAGLAGAAVALCFSLLIVGTVRSGDLRREGRGSASLAYGALAVAMTLAIAALVVFGIVVIVKG